MNAPSSTTQPRSIRELEAKRLLVWLGLLALVCALAAYGAARSHAATATPATIPGIVDVNTNLSDLNPPEEAAGTGMVLTSTGEILTNNHVIRDATSIHVTDLDNGKTYAATVVGYDMNADVAVLQLKDASGLATAPIGNSASLKVGESITAIGNAGGVGGTPSEVTGTVTALHRSITAEDDSGGLTSEQLKGLIETNADIQPGDSGGPIVNSAGQIVGMDTAGSQSSNFYFEGTTQGYAIPIDTATSVANAIEAGKASSAIHVGTTPFLGVGVETVPQFEQSQASYGGLGFGFGYSVEQPAVSHGLVILDTVPGTPVAKAGLGQYDVITSIDGHNLTTLSQLTTYLLDLKAGTQVKLGWVNSKGTSHTTTLTLASGPPQ